MHSTRTMLSTYSQLIKNNLHRPLKEAMGALTNKQQQLITALEIIRIEDFISHRFGVGRPADDRVPMARAFIAKAIYGHTTTRQPLDQLQSDIRLRRSVVGKRRVTCPRSGLSHVHLLAFPQPNYRQGSMSSVDYAFAYVVTKK